MLRPPRTPWERQDEHTPRPDDPERFGPYVWGKSRQEELVERDAPALGIAVRIIRPGALVDWSEPELPGVNGTNDQMTTCRPLFHARNRSQRPSAVSGLEYSEGRWPPALRAVGVGKRLLLGGSCVAAA